MMNIVSGQDRIKILERYYSAIIERNFSVINDCLTDDVALRSPLAYVQGKESVLGAIRGLSQVLRQIIIRARFADDKRAVLVYDFIFTNNVGLLRCAGLFDFKDNRISNIELFYDSKPFDDADKEEIF